MSWKPIVGLEITADGIVFTRSSVSPEPDRREARVPALPTGFVAELLSRSEDDTWSFGASRFGDGSIS